MTTKMKNLARLIAVAAFSLGAVACTAKNIPVAGHPESIAEDDDHYYVAVVGKKLEPTRKDGDGFILKVNSRGKVLTENAFPGVKLDAPKGAVIEDDILYVADIDRIVGINLRTGAQVCNVDMASTGAQFLNDIVEDDDFLYVSATDINKIFRINMRNWKFEELPLAEPLNAPNGLAIEDGFLYIGEYASDADGNPIGRIKKIPLAGNGPRPVSVVYAVPGQYDGLIIREVEDMFDRETGYLYFSDWASKSVKRINLKTGKAEDVTPAPVSGPADFIIEDDKLWLPVMAEQKVLIQTL